METKSIEIQIHIFLIFIVNFLIEKYLFWELTFDMT